MGAGVTTTATMQCSESNSTQTKMTGILSSGKGALVPIWIGYGLYFVWLFVSLGVSQSTQGGSS